MIFKRYIKDKEKGISMEIEYPYRAIKLKKYFVIYRMDSGKIIEKIPYEKVDSVYEDKAIKRLCEINKIEKILSNKIKNEIDTTN